MRFGLIICQCFAYYLSFLLFGTGGALLNLFCALVFWLPATPGRERFFQRLIHRHFAFWVWWLRQTRLVSVHYEGLERLPRDRSLVLVANHPGLMDITYLLARVPEAVCIFKPAIRRNPVLGGAARLAGYLASDGGLDLIRAAGVKVAAGHTVIIFPEGTRTRGGPLNPLKAGFVLIARRSGAPIQAVLITCDSNILIKGQAWWKLPRLPAHVTVSLGPLFPPPETGGTAALVAEVDGWFRRALASQSPPPITGVARPAAG
jgi:1-acyl-sn-glycerol-3-phosphate acyltransferase